MFHSIGLNLKSAEHAKLHKVRWYLSKETTQAKMSYIYIRNWIIISRPFLPATGKHSVHFMQYFLLQNE